MVVLRFNDCTPSWSLTFCLDLSEANTRRLDNIQKNMRNAFGIVIGDFSSKEWIDFQNKLSMGSMRLLLVTTVKQAAQAVKNIREVMLSADKYQAQDRYFATLMQTSQSASGALTVYKKFLQEVGASDDEAEIIMIAFPTLYALFTSTRELLESTLPINAATIDSISLMIESSAPTLSNPTK